MVGAREACEMERVKRLPFLVAVVVSAALASCSSNPGAPDPSGTPRPLTARPVALDLGVVPISADADGAPRLLRAVAPAPVVAATVEDAARVHVERLAPLWGLRAPALPELAPAGTVATRPGTIVRLEQRIDGLPVDGGELRLLLGDAGELRGASGVVVSTEAPRAKARFAIDEAGAIARAAGGANVLEARAAKVWRRDGDRLVAAWRVEAYTGAASGVDATATRAWIAADDGRVLGRRSLTANEVFEYRVFAEASGPLRPLDGPLEEFAPHPSGVPDGSKPAYVAPVLVAVEGLNEAPGGGTDPWLPDGATETVGNNADVYADFNAPSGLSEGDFRASVTAPGTFDRVYDVAAEPMASQAQQMAAVTNLFYAVNWLHDFWYDAGFTEVAGNAQASNYGRGGVEGDVLRIEAQDNALGGSRNNANMSTPGDGMSPRMQVYLWSGEETRALTIGGETVESNGSGFGGDFDVTGEVVIADAAQPLACAAVAGDLTGKIGLVDRGDCTFETKAMNLANAGAVGMIVANHTAGQPAPFMGGDSAVDATLPALSVTYEEGLELKTAIAEGAVTARLQRELGVELDGSLDGTLVAHEFGHYLHHRLSDCGTAQCGAMSEGWGDFLSLMLSADDGDDLAGVYPITPYATRGDGGDAAYYGIRRAPYSTNRAVNPLTFAHMADGVELPTSAPIRIFGNNAEVHNAGEVWAQMLWDGYVALQGAAPDFATGQRKMAEYIVAGLLMSPPDGTVTEVRDAILLAARAASPADHDLLAAAFAARGFGSCAVAAPRDSVDFVGIVEDLTLSGRVDPGSPALAETESCDDDGVLDAGETARITVPVANGGPAAITDVEVAIATTTPGLTITPVTASFDQIDAYGTAEATFDVALADATEPVAADLAITITSEGACVDQVATSLLAAMNVSDQLEASATDGFDATTTVWDAVGDLGAEIWSRPPVTPLDRVWHGLDHGAESDTALVSPVLEADATAPVELILTHRYAFESSQDTNWDGGVIEISTDGGTTWTDLADLVDPGYTGVLVEQGNPLSGRNAFTGESAGYPDFATQTIDLGTALAGETFQVRFRIGTDGAVGAPGWELAEVGFTGIVGTPFPAQVADPGSCAGTGPDAGDDEPGDDEGGGGGDGGGCCSTGGGGAGSLALGLAVLGVLVRRRRRA